MFYKHIYLKPILYLIKLISLHTNTCVHIAHTQLLLTGYRPTTHTITNIQIIMSQLS